MLTTGLEDKRVTYGIDADIMMRTDKRKVKGMIADHVDSIFAERNQAEIQNEVEETLVDMLKLGNIAASNRIKNASARYLEAIMIGFSSRGAADDVRSQCF